MDYGKAVDYCITHNSTGSVWFIGNLAKAVEHYRELIENHDGVTIERAFYDASEKLHFQQFEICEWGQVVETRNPQHDFVTLFTIQNGEAVDAVCLHDDGEAQLPEPGDVSDWWESDKWHIKTR